MNLKYTIGSIVSLPLLPLIYFQGKKIKKRIPKLSEAKDSIGVSFMGSNKGKLEVILIGESTFAGVGVNSHQQGFAGAFADQLSKCFEKNIHYRVYARSGYTAKSVVHKILPKIEEKYADIILIGLGGNDAFKLTTPEKWKEDITLLTNSVQKRFPSTPIVFCNLPPIKTFPVFTRSIKFVIGNLVEILGQELKDLASEWDNVYFNDEVITIEGWKSRFKIEGEIGDFFSDGLHPSQLTYQTWGKEMANVVADQYLANRTN